MKHVNLVLTQNRPKTLYNRHLRRLHGLLPPLLAYFLERSTPLYAGKKESQVDSP